MYSAGYLRPCNKNHMSNLKEEIKQIDYISAMSNSKKLVYEHNIKF